MALNDHDCGAIQPFIMQNLKYRSYPSIYAMSTSVRVKSNICAKTTKITVSMTPEGEFEVQVKSDCDNIKNYAKGLEKLSMEDLIDKPNSKVIRRYCDISMSTNCLVPSGLLTAAWIEAGLISRSRAKAVGQSVVEYIVDE